MARLKASGKEAKQFVKDWTGRGDEKQDTQAFWIQLLDKVFEDHNYSKDILFEQTADKIEGGKFFKDAVIHRHTDHAVLIEQKGMKYALDQKEPRHGLMLTPFEQAKEYDDKSGFDDKARWIITCNFKEFWIYDMTKTGKELYTPVAKLKLEDLPKHLDWLAMIGKEKNLPKQTFTEEVEVSTKAGELVGILYDDLYKNYKNPDDETLRQLNILCVRIVFCLYAEDAGLFDKDNRKMFHDYLAQFDAQHMRRALASLFKVLNQDPDRGERDKYLEDDDPMLAAFPYVNGGLFEGDVEIPPFTDETVDILLNKESMGFDWSKISPTIFGAVFESTLNQETRRKGGMHYTSLENIHKVIDPLFLNDLNKELDEILALKTHNIRNRRLREFQDKLSLIRCFDPACGSGNFLTESYLSLRRLENKALKARLGQNIAFGFEEAELTPIKVSIQQFYGIEINDFAVSVAKTALWIAEAQMFEETQTILNSDKDFLPLKTFTNIHEGNALRTDWNSVIDRRTEHLYIIGNPPFVGARLMSKSQKDDINELFKGWKGIGNIDYVGGWYKKAAEFIASTSTKVALVSTNSITQGEEVPALWKTLFSEYDININFAYRTFIWANEALDNASVHCVIIGFSCHNERQKILFDKETTKQVSNINGYLLDAPNIFIESRKKAICNVPEMCFGSMPNDGGFLSDYTTEQKNEIIIKYPKASRLFKRFLGASEFLHNKERWCLWLKDISPLEYKDIPPVVNAVQKVYEIRTSSNRKNTKLLAETPALFGEIRQPKNNYLIVPRHSSGNRKYIPIGYENSDVICGDANLMIPDASLYSLGVLESSVHMMWVSAICGRIKSDFRYSATLVYNNYPWPCVDEKSKERIEDCARLILDARNHYPDASLSDLYDNLILYPDLLKAHEANDCAVMDAYGFDKEMTEAEIVAELMKMYQKLTN